MSEHEAFRKLWLRLQRSAERCPSSLPLFLSGAGGALHTRALLGKLALRSTNLTTVSDVALPGTLLR